MACVRLPRVRFSGQAAHTPSVLQAHGLHLSLCLTPVCGLILGIMLVVEMSELSKPSKHEEDLQDPGKAQGMVEAQLSGAKAGEAASL